MTNLQTSGTAIKIPLVLRIAGSLESEAVLELTATSLSSLSLLSPLVSLLVGSDINRVEDETTVGIKENIWSRCSLQEYLGRETLIVVVEGEKRGAFWRLKP